MNIIIVSSLYYPTIGGVTTYIDKKADYLSKKGFNVELLCPIKKEDYDILDRLFIKKLSYSVKFFILENLGINSQNIVTGFMRKLSYNRSKFDIYDYIIKNYNSVNTIIHQHDLISNINLIRKLKKNNYKIVLTNHTGETLLWKKIPIIGNLIIDKQFSYYDKIIGPSKELAFISSKNKEKSLYFPNSISIKETLSPMEEKEKISFLCPRRWAPTKGIKYYLEGIKLLKERNRELFDSCEFIFAGNDYNDYVEYKNECEKIYNEINSNNLVLLGDIKEYEKMMKLYKNATFTIIPSLYEAVSLSALEAAISGSVILTTDVGGMPELISSPDVGLMCKPKSSEEIYKILVQAIKMSEKTYEQTRINSYNNIYKNFNYDELIKKHITLYKELLK